jgi:polysaccharide export outer membrane protein
VTILGAAFLGAMPAVSGEGPIADETPPRDAFVIGVEDQLSIVVWNEPELSKQVKVRPDGRVSLPLIQDVEVVGRTPEQVRILLTEKLKAVALRDPIVTVIVDQINSFRVYFLGEVTTQGAMQFYRPIRILQAVAEAGGPTQYSKKQITLVREEFGLERRMEIDYKKLLEGATGQENLYLRPGDTLIFK